MQNRKALIIGNSQYLQSAPLRNPANDARAMAAALKRLGFVTFTGIDLDRDAMEDQIGTFEREIDGADVALLFYAGHGLQVNGQNYIIPIDADIRQEVHLKRRAFALDELLAIMTRRAHSSVIFLDACRDNPFSRTLMTGMPAQARSSVTVRSGLAEVSISKGVFVAFATAPNQVASDGREENSPFTLAVLQYIDEPNVSIDDLLLNVRIRVLELTEGQQEPWQQSSLRTRIVFNQTKDQTRDGFLPLVPLEKDVTIRKRSPVRRLSFVQIGFAAAIGLSSIAAAVVGYQKVQLWLQSPSGTSTMAGQDESERPLSTPTSSPTSPGGTLVMAGRSGLPTLIDAIASARDISVKARLKAQARSLVEEDFNFGRLDAFQSNNGSQTSYTSSTIFQGYASESNVLTVRRLDKIINNKNVLEDYEAIVQIYIGKLDKVADFRDQSTFQVDCNSNGGGCIQYQMLRGDCYQDKGCRGKNSSYNFEAKDWASLQKLRSAIITVMYKIDGRPAN